MMTESVTFSPIRSTKTFIILILSFVVIVWSFQSIGFTFDKLVNGVPPLLNFLSEMYPPDATVVPTLLESAVETIQMVIAGTSLGMVLALPLAAMASNNISPKPLVVISRSLLIFTRTIPSLLWALIFVILVGLGPFSGVLALTFYTLGYLGKFFYEIIESIDMESVEGVVSAGANRTQVFIYAIMPQVLTHITNNFFFMLEYNIRSASILGFVGAGGLGFYIFLYLRSFEYDKVAMAIVILLGLVIAFDRLSLEVRKRMV